MKRTAESDPLTSLEEYARFMLCCMTKKFAPHVG